MKERILITVKTYPTLSKKHGKLVCTAGLREDGSWVRIYPVPFRRLEDYEQYRKYQWLSARLTNRKDDPRPESASPDIDSIELGDFISTKDKWAERCRYVLNKGVVYDDMSRLIDLANDNQLSLATYKPAEVVDFLYEAQPRTWPADKLRIIEQAHRQGDLFAKDDQFKETFRTVKKMPYAFSYKFKNKDGKLRKLMIEDWEIGALYWKMLNRSGGDEALAIQGVREKYLDYFVEKTDLHLFVGTTRQFHGWASNPFVITGLFTPPRNRHRELALW